MGNELYVRFGAMPTRGLSDQASTDPYVADQTLVIPETQAGTYYVMLYGDTVSGAPAYDLTAEVIPFSVRAVGPNQVGNAGASSFKVEGARFDAETVFTLRNGDDNLLGARRVVLENPGTAYVTFDFFDAPLGDWDLVATDGKGTITTVPGAVTVVTGNGTEADLGLDAPLEIRPLRNYLINVAYGNAGDADLSAPVLVVDSANGVPLGMTYDDVRANDLHVLGASLDGASDTLRPGQQHSVAVTFTSPASTAEMDIRIRAMTVDNRTVISDWSAIENAVRPADIGDEAWNAFWIRIQPQIGDTWGNYVELVNRLHAEVAVDGKVVCNVRELFARIYEEQSDFNPFTSLNGQVLDSTTGETNEMARPTSFATHKFISYHAESAESRATSSALALGDNHLYYS